MSEFDDITAYELCFPGSMTGEAEVVCPYCDEVLTIDVQDPMGQVNCRCGECHGVFEVDFAEQTVTPITTIQLCIEIELDETVVENNK